MSRTDPFREWAIDWLRPAIYEVLARERGAMTTYAPDMDARRISRRCCEHGVPLGA